MDWLSRLFERCRCAGARLRCNYGAHGGSTRAGDANEIRTMLCFPAPRCWKTRRGPTVAVEGPAHPFASW